MEKFVNASVAAAAVKIYDVDTFIIPNSIHTFRESDKNDPFYGSRVWLQFDHIKNYPVKAISDVLNSWENESFVELWFVTKGSEDSNWFDHCIDGYPELKDWRPVTNRLPVSLFKSYKEGAAILVPLLITKGKEYKSINVLLKLNNLSYRYRNFGPFEEAIKGLNICEGIYHKD